MLDIQIETGWTDEYIGGMSINLIAAMAIQIRQRQNVDMVPAMASRVKPEEDKSTKRWEERIAPDRARVHSRVNISDLFDHPELLSGAINPS
jgi:hypothetical protein